LSNALAGRTIQVGPGHAIHSVKAGLAAANPHDTLVVHAGTYKEGNIIIDKPIVLLGEGRPILDGENKYEILSIKSDSVTVIGFAIHHSGIATLEDLGGIKIYDSHHVRIIDNELYDTFFAIYLQYSRHCLVRGNRIIGLGKEEQEIGNGIHCWKSDSLQIIRNEISGHRDGIYFEFVQHSLIWCNIAKHNLRYGLHFMFSNDDAYITNYFLENGAGVAVMFTRRVTMMNNTFSRNWGDAAYGLLLKEITDSYLFNNRFTENTIGVLMEGSNRILFEKNAFDKNGWALKMQANCDHNTVRENNFTSNTFDASTNGTLVLNTFERNYWDKYAGYDMDKNTFGDVPYRPLSLFAMIVEHNPPVMLLFRSFMVTLLEQSEKLIPTLTPAGFKDESPRMQPIAL
jgi:nitrous oxidase accessory protein